MDDEKTRAEQERPSLLWCEDVEAAIAAVNADLVATVPVLEVRSVLWDGEADGWGMGSVVTTVGDSTFSPVRDVDAASFLSALADRVVDDGGVAVWRGRGATVPVGRLRGDVDGR